MLLSYCRPTSKQASIVQANSHLRHFYCVFVNPPATSISKHQLDTFKSKKSSSSPERSTKKSTLSRCIQKISSKSFILYYLKQQCLSVSPSFCLSVCDTTFPEQARSVQNESTNVIHLWIGNDLLSVLYLVRIFQGGLGGMGG